MKKFLAVMVSCMMVMSLVACGGTEEVSGDSSVQVEAEAPVVEKEESAPVEEKQEAVAEVEEKQETAVEENADSGTGSVWDTIAQVEAPDMSNTAWEFAGGYIDGVELTQEDYDAALQAYGGSLQFVFDENGGAQMVQGGGTLQGTYSYGESESVSVVFDNNGTELSYVCLFTESEGLYMLAFTDPDNCVYFRAAEQEVVAEETTVAEGEQIIELDVANTTWNFAGGFIDSVEMTEEEAAASLEMYGGTLQLVFDDGEGVQMVQGGGTLEGRWAYSEDNTVGVLFELEDGDLFYLCSFAEIDGQVVMVAYSDESGENAIYFVQ